MGKSNAACNSFLALQFNGATWPGIAQNVSVTPNAALYIALHSADPTPGGNQSTNEIAYSGYNRVAVVRSPAGWVVANESASAVSNVLFGAGVMGLAPVATFFSIGLQQTGAGEILYSGPVTPNIQCGNGEQPNLSTILILEE